MPDLSFRPAANGAIDTQIAQLLAAAGVTCSPELIREMIVSALKAGQEACYPADLMLMNTTMKEMRYTNKTFAPYRDKKKVTIFGSARTSATAPIYRKCQEFARLLVESGFMVITGGGGGIMQAGNEGAGPANSFAVNIRLPFEQATNPVMEKAPTSINYKYFFNRKVAFLKEAAAIALFPGGFGTLDEAMETLTLLQTGKTEPVPVVLIDDDDGSYWEPFLDFTRRVLLEKGLVSAEDFRLFSLVRTPAEAVRIISDFYRVYHSSRYVGAQFVIRLRHSLPAPVLAALIREFADILIPGGGIVQRAGGLPEEADEPDLLPLPRLVVDFNRQSYGRLKTLIERLNELQP